MVPGKDAGGEAVQARRTPRTRRPLRGSPNISPSRVATAKSPSSTIEPLISALPGSSSRAAMRRKSATPVVIVSLGSSDAARAGARGAAVDGDHPRLDLAVGAQGVLDVAREALRPCRAGSAASCRRRARAGRCRSPPCAPGAGRRSCARSAANACSPRSRAGAGRSAGAAPSSTAVAVGVGGAGAHARRRRAGVQRRDRVGGVGLARRARAAPARLDTAGASRCALAALALVAPLRELGHDLAWRTSSSDSQMCSWRFVPAWETKMIWSTPAAS